MGERNYTFDVIRITAMVLIICMHTPIPGVGTPGVVLSTISYLTAPSIGLFLMISGALLHIPVVVVLTCVLSWVLLYIISNMSRNS